MSHLPRRSLGPIGGQAPQGASAQPALVAQLASGASRHEAVAAGAGEAHYCRCWRCRVLTFSDLRAGTPKVAAATADAASQQELAEAASATQQASGATSEASATGAGRAPDEAGGSAAPSPTMRQLLRMRSRSRPGTGAQRHAGRQKLKRKLPTPKRPLPKAALEMLEDSKRADADSAEASAHGLSSTSALRGNGNQSPAAEQSQDRLQAEGSIGQAENPSSGGGADRQNGRQVGSPVKAGSSKASRGICAHSRSGDASNSSMAAAQRQATAALTSNRGAAAWWGPPGRKSWGYQGQVGRCRQCGMPQTFRRPCQAVPKAHAVQRQVMGVQAQLTIIMRC